MGVIRIDRFTIDPADTQRLLASRHPQAPAAFGLTRDLSTEFAELVDER
jgi:hypothetical protein